MQYLLARDGDRGMGVLVPPPPSGTNVLPVVEFLTQTEVCEETKEWMKVNTDKKDRKRS